MKVPVNSIRAGNVIEYNGKLWVASKVQHISPGKGGAFVAIEAKALREGNKLQERFRSGETIEHVHIDERECTYLFKDDNGYTFMDKETFEQLTVGADVLDPDQSRWLQDGMEVNVSLYEGTPVGVELPKSVVLAVIVSPYVVVIGVCLALSRLKNRISAELAEAERIAAVRSEWTTATST
jgi:elongation factor P